MSTRIPMVGERGDAILKGMTAGGNLFQQIMHPILAREQLKQKTEHDAASLAQLENHFQAKFGLDKAAAGRAAQAAMDNHRIAMNKLDPTFQAKQYEALENYFKSKMPGNQQPNEMNAGQVPQEPMPQQESGEGLGLFSPQGMQEAQQMPQQPQMQISQAQNPSGINNEQLNLMRQFPALRGLHKKIYGVDPLAEMSKPYQGEARNAMDLERLRKEVASGAIPKEVYENAMAEHEAKVGSKKDLADLRARTKAGLRPGEKEFFDSQSGVPLGKEIPLTAAERQSEEGNILFNELYPYVYKGASPFSGEGSISRLEQAAANYKTDPKARKLMDDFLLAEKMMAATTVNESATLKAGKTNRTYTMLKESLESQDIPKLAKKLVKEYQLPPSAQLHAAMRYQKLLSDARQKSRKQTPATQKLFYNPEMQAQYEAEQNEGLPTTTKSKSVIVINPNGNKFETTEENAKHLPAGWKRG